MPRKNQPGCPCCGSTEQCGYPCLACGGVYLLSGGTLTDANGVTSFFWAQGDNTYQSVDSIRNRFRPPLDTIWNSIDGVFCSTVALFGVYRYAYVFACDLDGSISLGILTPPILPCTGFPEGVCGYFESVLGVLAPLTETFADAQTPVCVNGFMTATFTFSDNTTTCPGKSIPPPVYSATISFPLTPKGQPCCRLCVDVVDCSGAKVSGATVSVKQGGNPIGTCFTDSDGNCCVTVNGRGTYEVSVTKTGYWTGGKAGIEVTCPETTVEVKIDNNISHQYQVNVTGCSVPQQGATVTLDGVTATTDADGNAYFTISETKLATLVVRKDPWEIYTAPVAVSACFSGFTDVTLSLDPARWFCCLRCPVPVTMNVFDGCGAATLVYNAGLGAWMPITPCLSTSGTIVSDDGIGACDCNNPTDGSVLYNYLATCPGNDTISLTVVTPEVDCDGTHYWRDSVNGPINFPSAACSAIVLNSSYSQVLDLGGRGCTFPLSILWPGSLSENLGHPCPGTVAVTS